jgi:mannose/fructose/N-acetylgalactosamine-specific phosphotransferase system component IIC
MLGSAVSSLGPVVTSIVGKLVAGGMSAAAAWGWVIAVVAAVAALTIAVVGIVKAVQNASPEKKLENARKEADKAAEAADSA